MISFKFGCQRMFAKDPNQEPGVLIFWSRENLGDVQVMVRPQTKGDDQNIQSFILLS